MHQQVSGGGRIVSWAMMAGGVLWAVHGYLRFLTPQGADVVWRPDLSYSLILRRELFVLYNVPGILALLLTAGAVFVMLSNLSPVRTWRKLAARILAVVALLFAVMAVAGQLLPFDALTTGGLNFGLLALGGALIFTGAAGNRDGTSNLGLPGRSCMLLGAVGISILALRPLMFALGLLPLFVGTLALALFGAGWVIFGIRLRFATQTERASAENGRYVREGLRRHNPSTD